MHANLRAPVLWGLVFGAAQLEEEKVGDLVDAISQ
jgi:hypothetical protein